MSAYTEHGGAFPLETTPAGGIEYVLAKPLSWDIGFKGSGHTVTIPAGYRFEVSVPQPFRWIFDPHDPAYHKAAALHDWLLENGWDRITAAGEFHRALKAEGVALWKRAIMLLAVQFWKYR